jgi:hypothetical protein
MRLAQIVNKCMAALAAKKYASSYGKTPPLLLSFASSTLNLEELQNTSKKLVPIVAAEVVQNMLLRSEEFVPHNSAQWVAMRNFQLRHLRYGECATLSNGLLTEIVKETAYQTGEMQVSQFDINPKNQESFRRGLDHTAILLELDGRVILADPLLRTSCDLKDFPTHPPVVRYYEEAADISEKTAIELAKGAQLTKKIFDPSLVNPESLRHWDQKLETLFQQDDLTLTRFVELTKVLDRVEDAQPHSLRSFIRDLMHNLYNFTAQNEQLLVDQQTPSVKLQTIGNSPISLNTNNYKQK